MAERKDLRDLLRDTDFTQKRIIDDLANSEVSDLSTDREVTSDLRRGEGGDFLKSFFVGVVLIGIVIGSFWISFLIGRKILVPPVKNIATIESPVFSEAQMIPKAISQSEVEKAAPAKEESPIIERELRPETVKPVVKPRTVAAAPVRAAAVASTAPIKTLPSRSGTSFVKVIVGSYSNLSDATLLSTRLKAKGFPYYVKRISGTYRVQAGAFDSREKASPLVSKLRESGFTPTVIME